MWRLNPRLLVYCFAPLCRSPAEDRVSPPWAEKPQEFVHRLRKVRSEFWMYRFVHSDSFRMFWCHAVKKGFKQQWSRRGAAEPQSVVDVVEVVEVVLLTDAHLWIASSQCTDGVPLEFLHGLSMTSRTILYEITDITVFTDFHLCSYLFIKSVHHWVCCHGRYNNSFVHFASVVDGSRKNVKLAKIATCRMEDMAGLSGLSKSTFQVGNEDGRVVCICLFRVDICQHFGQISLVSVEFRWFVTGSWQRMAEPSPGATEPCPRRLGRGRRGGAPFRSPRKISKKWFYRIFSMFLTACVEYCWIINFIFLLSFFVIYCISYINYIRYHLLLWLTYKTCDIYWQMLDFIISHHITHYIAFRHCTSSDEALLVRNFLSVSIWVVGVSPNRDVVTLWATRYAPECSWHPFRHPFWHLRASSWLSGWGV